MLKRFWKVVKIKFLRRSIIIICAILLIISNINIFPESKYYYDEIKNQVSAKKAEDIEINKSMTIDKDKIIIERIIIAKDAVYLRYSTRMNGLGWSFCDGNAIKMYDDKQHLYICTGGGTSGKIWGQDGVIEFEKLDKDARYIVLKLDWYDRKDEIKVPLNMEGEASENK